MSVEELDVVLTFLDVGHGDATVLRFREGHNVRTVVVDGGGPDHSGDLLDYLLRNTITTIDLMVATHVDRNHVAGLIPVVESDRVAVHNFWGPGCESTQPSVPGLRTPDERTYQRLYARVNQALRPEHILCPTRGMPLPALSTAARFTVLNPARANVLKPTPENAPQKKPAELALEQNELATVLHIECYGLNILLASDVEGPFWDTAAADADLQRLLEVDVLKAPNYGRASGLPRAAAGVLRTGYAVFSLGAETDGEPSEEAIALMRQIGAEVICTEHAPDNGFCGSPTCPAARGGQNVVFCRRRGDSSYSTSAYFCPRPGTGQAPPG
ncbi:MAG: ComEC/Rec2 family competence protein [Candidatus Brocadiia bacterium]